MRWALAAVVAALVLARIPSLVQPAGGDQGIYAYVGQAIRSGQVPYRDAWDQKPPAVHLTYAVMFGLWDHESVVALTDLLVTLGVCGLLVGLARRLTDHAGAGGLAAVVFLLLADPSFQRLGGVWVRAQAETFIGLAVAAAVLLAVVARRADAAAVRRGRALALSACAGALLGITFLYKYNAGIFVLPVAAAYLAGIPASRDPRNWHDAPRALLRHTPALIVGFLVPVGATLAWFAWHGALDDLIQATFVYNLRYSGETYSGPAAVVRHLATFPVAHARVDGLWFVGGLGCLVLTVTALRSPAHAVVPVWVAAACASIAINGSRGLPQYFLQAGPPLALAAGLAGAVVWRGLGSLSRVLLCVLLVVAVGRINQFDKWFGCVTFDAAHLGGRIPRDDYLARFGGQRATDKYSALATARLGDRLRTTTSTADRVLVVGFSPGALVRAHRLSASRFFWSRPLLVGFNEGRPGYGPAGLLAELTRWRPAEVVLQRRDWPAEGIDSATWFLRQPSLASWLADHYRQADDTGTYVVWRRRDLL